MSHLKNYCITLGSVLLLGLLLISLEADVLYEAQNQNLFLHTPLFFEQQMMKAGGFLTWIGSYLTQYFFYPTLGTSILCLLWLFLIWLIHKAYPETWLPLALLPIGCLLLTIVDMGYWVYYLKLPGHPFDTTVGTVVAIGLAAIYRSLPQRLAFTLPFTLIAVIIGYPAFGFYALWGTLLIGILAATKKQWIVTVVAAIGIVVVPLAAYHLLYHETNIAYIYWSALPMYSHNGQQFFAYYLPIIALVICTVGWCFISHPLSNRRWVLLGRCGAVLLFITGIIIGWNRNDNFHRELSMSHDMEQQQWEDILTTAQHVKGEPTRAICLMKNIALLRLGRDRKEMLTFPEGSKHPDAPFAIRMVHTIGKQVYLQYGIPNYCYRWCMEDGVEYGWTVERLKLMTLCSLLNGEPTAARRFTALLKKTTFHKDWAKKYEACTHNPKLVLGDEALSPILPYLRDDNFLTSDQSQLELFLFEHLLGTPNNNRQQEELAQRTMFYYRSNHQKLVEP